MDRTRAKELLPVIQAFAEGKEVEYYAHGSWNGLRGLVRKDANFDTGCEWRIKPSPQYRPWTFDEVPIGAIVKFECGDKVLIGGVSGKTVYFAWEGVRHSVCLDGMKGMTHSVDGGKYWWPCGVKISDNK